MKAPKHSLRKIVSFLNNPEEEGGFWLPNIQRPFVWSEEQICRLFDSILREYPISTLLVWKTRSPIRRRRFIDNYRVSFSHELSKFYVPEDDKKKCLVLDGQQRLQSLFIGLKGSYEGKELYLDILSGQLAAPDDVKYRFEFRLAEDSEFPWMKFKDLVYSTRTPMGVAQNIISNAGRTLTSEEAERISEHVSLVFKAFHSDDGLAYQELDNTENVELYAEDDVVEIFIRANSGGTRLGKSDLLFSLLSTSWDEADARMEEVLERLNRHGFKFTRDFVLKTCLTLLGQGARYEVDKFRKPDVQQRIEKHWDDITAAMLDVLDFVRGKTFIRCDKAIPSYLALIPLIYARFRYKAAFRAAKNVDAFLLRSLLGGAFSGIPDQMIDALVAEIDLSQDFNTDALFGVMREKNRSPEIAPERLWTMGYGSDSIHLLLNLWYRGFNYTPSYENNLPQVDHIFPQSLLKRAKVENPRTFRKDLMRYREPERNQLANCMLLTAEENGGGGKGDIAPVRWLRDKPEEYFALHLIPTDPELWKLKNFEQFIEARKALLLERLGPIVGLTNVRSEAA
ncbi:hypothetical protein A176_006877 [Myxococcus hansupus]|uniref:DUF262 domain-containing protein n=1 Tax=Pseudomyxococcus hansupus TaxID=1297742 RepID=A0A0H4X8R8_9BACT|nr:DUF262 domain-containing protein [Myxococcus hansupus]AKQ69965.1 hypothetical protein A176_006877 [Myxococcus hansupus]